MSTTSDEKPIAKTIRGLRAMAIVRWILLAVVTAVAVRTVWTFWGPNRTDHALHAENRYQCPMHPQIRSPNPGECPICHMDLEPIADEQIASAPPDSESDAAVPPDVVGVSVSAEKQSAIGLVTSEVTAAKLGGKIRVPGVVSAPETGVSQVRVRAAGFVEKVAVSQTGVLVARGQTLAWIYSPEIYRAEEEFLAATRWNGTNVAPGDAPTMATEIQNAARKSLELLGLDNGDIDALVREKRPTRALPVRAPASGYVTRFNAVLGFRAEPETVLYEIVDLSTIWVIASVHERDAGGIRSGTTAIFSVAGRSIKARVELVDPQLDENSRTTRVRLTLKNRDLSLKPGQFGEVTFELPAAPGIFVPRDAVIHTGANDYVYVSDGGEAFAPRVVRTGIEIEDSVQILQGLVAGERVVTRGSFMLDSESRLRASLSGKSEPSR